ncbi:MAG: helix-turn-helix transcriptional regulator [Pseudomonadota bacterium]
MAQALQEELHDAVYGAALDPAAWQDLMALLRRAFPSTAQTFYFLERETRHIRPVCLAGVQPRWVANFDPYYFAPDNPWMQVTRALHRPGVVRTTERLERFMQARGVLQRSAYYNDWMRPQGFEHNIGNTLLAEDGVVANITLFRPPDMAHFGDAEVRAFAALSRHMTRALRLSLRLERGEHCGTGTQAFDALPQALALVDVRCRLLYANAAMQALLRSRSSPLRLRQGELAAADAGGQQRLAAQVATVAARSSGAAGDDGCFLRGSEGGLFSLQAFPVHGALAQYLPSRRTLLLTVRPCSGRGALPCTAIAERHGCTPREALLARLLAQGHSLPDAAAAMGITHGSARAYLKIVFQKTGVRTQAQLVARLLGDGAALGAPATA